MNRYVEDSFTKNPDHDPATSYLEFTSLRLG
ncbi:Protein of unknown function [Lactobacillus hominis DSM 23910 = CRBIP 24.179]|uniref:Uncharacterized protein n=1 Tax=Lactobacillus hominis DSM 23910 = CRBIP 24.179 TaxID=1423758 RepID=I7L6E9_9LACO|nr:Protein of unknown function [Lactobacillus hominis DSM 23910 = CRBIP 24.179]